MTVITVTRPTPPTTADYAQMLEALLIEQALDKTLAHSIANHVEYGTADLYALVDSMLDHGLNEAQWTTLTTFMEEMSEDVDTWRPSTADFYRSAADHQEMREIHPVLDRACWRFGQLVDQINITYYSH